MDLTTHTINTLFDQLGLPSSDADIERFCSEHKLDHDTLLLDASFWNEGQRTFLEEALEDDSDWAEVADQLNAMLRT